MRKIAIKNGKRDKNRDIANIKLGEIKRTDSGITYEAYIDRLGRVKVRAKDKRKCCTGHLDKIQHKSELSVYRPNKRRALKGFGKVMIGFKPKRRLLKKANKCGHVINPRPPRGTRPK